MSVKKLKVYNLYQEYAFRAGFSVRNYDNERKIIRFKVFFFFLSKEGFKNNESEDEVAYERVDSRTNCEI